MKPIALQDTTTREKAQNGRGWSEDGTSYTLDAAATQGVAIPLDLRNAGRDPEKHDEINPQGVGVGAPGEPSHTISTACVHGVVYGLDEEQNAGRELFGTLKARQAGGGFEGAVAVDCYNQTISDVAIPIRSKASDIDHTGGVLVPTDAVQVQWASGGAVWKTQQRKH